MITRPLPPAVLTYSQTESWCRQRLATTRRGRLSRSLSRLRLLNRVNFDLTSESHPCNLPSLVCDLHLEHAAFFYNHNGGSMHIQQSKLRRMAQLTVGLWLVWLSSFAAVGQIASAVNKEVRTV